MSQQKVPERNYYVVVSSSVGSKVQAKVIFHSPGPLRGSPFYDRMKKVAYKAATQAIRRRVVEQEIWPPDRLSYELLYCTHTSENWLSTLIVSEDWKGRERRHE